MTRTFFDERGFIEVWTDSIVPAGAFESSIDPLTVHWRDGSAELHTSAEIEMKHVLSTLQRPIYQVCKVFRDDPPTEFHLREFTMLELYQPGLSVEGLKELTKDFLKSGSPNQRFKEVSVREVLLSVTGIDMIKTRTAETLRTAIESTKIIELSRDDSWSDMFFKLLIEKVEPSLDPEIPTLIYGYPAELSPLSEVDAASGEAARFEIYWKGMEICNGCEELESVEELKRRHGRESDSRRLRGKEPHPYPERLAQAMKQMPRSSGVAIGLDRLFACIYG